MNPSGIQHIVNICSITYYLINNQHIGDNCNTLGTRWQDDNSDLMNAVAIIRRELFKSQQATLKKHENMDLWGNDFLVWVMKDHCLKNIRKRVNHKTRPKDFDIQFV